MEPIHEIEIEEIQEEEEDEDLETASSNNKNKKWFKWVGPTIRKATIASMAAMAAPVIIPQMIVLTTLGGALCIPFGVYLGTIALTDKFMSYLFSVRREEMELGFDKEGGDEYEEEEDQLVYTEEEIKEQIEIIRVILGYKAPKNPSYLEELRAILRLIGIEPPIFLQELNEVSSTIHLLKSLIGVK